jgi:hypothetical protein
MEIFKKLLKVKGELGKISKDATNPFFKSKYFDINGLLEHVEPLLSKHDLLLLQPILNGKVISEIIDPDTGDKVSSEMELPNLTDPQKIGSAVTYYRRYTLQSLLGLQAEDDDANLASKKAYPLHNTQSSSIDLTKLTNKLKACTTIEMLSKTYKSFTDLEQKATAKLTSELKELLTQKQTA